MKDYTEQEIIDAYSVRVKPNHKPFSIFCVQNKVDEVEAKLLVDYLNYIRWQSSINTLRVLKGIIN